jgi:AcrR family transcriptional regulator
MEAPSNTLRLISPRKRLRQKASAVEPTRERILSAAAQVFAESGFTGASMPAIATRSGITAGAIYRHFASKAELLLEVVKRALEALPFSFERSRGEDDTAQLPEVAARLTDPAFMLLRRLSVETHAAASRDPEVNKLLSAYTETVLQRICALLEPQARDRLRNPSRAPEFTARTLIIFLTGLIHMDILYPQLVGDPAWRQFVASHVAALLGLKAQKGRKKSSPRRRASKRNAREAGQGTQKRGG